MMNELSYSEMMSLETFEARYEYLRLDGEVGRDTFGSERHLNQKFYRSAEWRRIRNHVIVRDSGMDLAHPDRMIAGPILVHHICPITPADIVHSTSRLYDLDNLVCVSKETHNAIHYGDFKLIAQEYVERTPGDTNLW